MLLNLVMMGFLLLCLNIMILGQNNSLNVMWRPGICYRMLLIKQLLLLLLERIPAHMIQILQWTKLSQI